VLEIVPKVEEVVLCCRYLSEWCTMCVMCAGGHALHTVLYTALYSRGSGGRAPFARGARVMRYVLEAEKNMRHVL